MNTSNKLEKPKKIGRDGDSSSKGRERESGTVCCSLKAYKGSKVSTYSSSHHAPINYYHVNCFHLLNQYHYLLSYHNKNKIKNFINICHRPSFFLHVSRTTIAKVMQYLIAFLSALPIYRFQLAAATIWSWKIDMKPSTVGVNHDPLSVSRERVRMWLKILKNVLVRTNIPYFPKFPQTYRNSMGQKTEYCL